MLIKCPHCGKYIQEYQFGKERDEIAVMLSKVSTRIKELLSKVSYEIRLAMPSENNVKIMHRFLVNIKNCSEESIIKTIEGFLLKEHQKNGKGFNYLSAMITNFEANKDKMKEYEKLRIGSSPPTRIVEENNG